MAFRILPYVETSKRHDKSIPSYQAPAHFLPNWFNDEIVNHIDGNKQNNHLENLEWCSRKYNYAHAARMDLIDTDNMFQFEMSSRCGQYHGSNNGMSKLTEDDVRYIREHYIPKGKGQKCSLLCSSLSTSSPLTHSNPFPITQNK